MGQSVIQMIYWRTNKATCSSSRNSVSSYLLRSIQGSRLPGTKDRLPTDGRSVLRRSSWRFFTNTIMVVILRRAMARISAMNTTSHVRHCESAGVIKDSLLPFNLLMTLALKTIEFPLMFICSTPSDLKMKRKMSCFLFIFTQQNLMS